jgi:hypothetical protein
MKTAANFQTISLYWSRPKASGEVAVQYRPDGAVAWKNAQPLWYDATSPNLAYKNQYRGSIVNLVAGTVYNLRYRIGAGAWTSAGSVRTRPDTFPSSANTVSYGRQVLKRTLVITQGGTADNWRIHDGQGTAVIDPDHTADCVAVKASYVVVRGFTIRDCRANGINIEQPNVVIERNTISDWGLQELFFQTVPRNGHFLNEATATCIPGVLKTDFGRMEDAAVSVKQAGNDGVVVQRNVIRDPRYRSTRWNECPSPGYADHPYGPRAIFIGAAATNFGTGNVIRYNNIHATNTKLGGAVLSDDANRYYDTVGVPYGQDLDIYGNIIRNATDDLIEADNAAVNVRIWGNYLDHALVRISHQKMEAGPSYIFRNIFDRGADAGPNNPGTWDVLIPNGVKPPVDSGAILKLKQDNSVGAPAFMGPVYVFHNTSLRAGEDGMKYAYSMGRMEEAARMPNNMPNIISKNNIFMTEVNYIHDFLPSNFAGYYFGDMHNMTNDTDIPYVLGTGDLQAPAVWKDGHGWGQPLGTAWTAPAIPTGRYQASNAGIGVPISNFNDPTSQGRGAHQHDPSADNPMQFGTTATWTHSP